MLGTRKVRTNSLYRYQPVMLDTLHPPHDIAEGNIVRVVNLHGCPRANTMGHCHVQHLGGNFAGLVCCNSLQALTPWERKCVKRAATAGPHRVPSKRFTIEYDAKCPRESVSPAGTVDNLCPEGFGARAYPTDSRETDITVQRAHMAAVSAEDH